MSGWSKAKALAMNIRDLIPEGQRERALACVKQLARAQVLEPYRTTDRQRWQDRRGVVDSHRLGESGSEKRMPSRRRRREVRGQNEDEASISRPGRSQTIN